MPGVTTSLYNTADTEGVSRVWVIKKFDYIPIILHTLGAETFAIFAIFAHFRESFCLFYSENKNFS